MLNWEKNRRNRMPKDYSSDTLPDTGSKEDILRWKRENSETKVFPNMKNGRQLSNRKFTPMHFAAEQLTHYLKCVQSAYFFDKPREHQKEIISGIRKLIAKININPNTSSSYERNLVKQAHGLVSSIRIQ